jgi:hypothetical protein
MLAVALAVLTPLAALGQATSWRLPDFSTNATTFVDLPGSPIRFTTDAGTLDLILLSAEFRGEPSAEVGLEFYVGPSPTQAAWGRASFATDGSRALSTWSYLDFSSAGVPRVLDVRLRATTPGGTASVFEPRITRIPLPAASVIAREVFPLTVVDAGSWSSLLALTVPRTGDWFLLGAATRADTSDAGLGVRIRAGSDTLPRGLDGGGPTAFALLSGPGWPQWFGGGHLTLTASTPVALEAFGAPESPGRAPAVTVGAIDLRLVAIEASAWPSAVQSTQATIDVSTTSPRQVLAIGSMVSGPVLALQQSLFAVSPGGTADLELRGPTRRFARGTTSLGARHGSACAVHLFEGDAGTPSFITFANGSPGQPMTTWGGFAAVFPLTMGLTELVFLEDGGLLQADAGTVDGGADAGATDAGRLDASVSDAGLVDGGPFDARAPDAGSPDSGAIEPPGDAGSPDAGPEEARPGAYLVGCHAAPELMAAALVLLLRRRISRSAPEESTSRRSA